MQLSESCFKLNLIFPILSKPMCIFQKIQNCTSANLLNTRYAPSVILILGLINILGSASFGG